MNLKIAFALIAVVLVILLILCALYPNSMFVMGATVAGSLLVVIQAYAILKENPNKGSDGNYKVP